MQHLQVKDIQQENTVLLVEDDPSALEELADIVELEGWTPLVAKSVDEAMEMLTYTPSIGVVVTDVHFVDENGEADNGLQLVSRAQAKFPERKIAFVVLSGDPDALRSSVQIGAIDFLNKPLVSDELVEAIKAGFASDGEERSVSELTSFLMEKMQKAAMALQTAHHDLEIVAAEKEGQAEENNRRFKAKMVRQALQQGYLLPWFQPQIDLETGRVCGFDTVARWVEPNGTRNDASRILEIASETGTQAEVDGAMRSAAIRALSYFARAGLDQCTIALRVASDLMKTPNLIERVVREAMEIGLEAETLKFEIPDSISTEGPAGFVVRENLASMPHRVLRVQMDQTDSGLRGVSALRGIDLHQINIDLTGIGKLQDRPDMLAVARALIGLSKAMGADVIASGVANDRDLDWLRMEGCDIAQGPVIAQAMPGDDAMSWALENLTHIAEEV